MKCKINKLILLFILFFSFSNRTFANDSLKLEIKIIKVTSEKLYCNFIYHFILMENNDIDIFLISLPFTQSSSVSSSLQTKQADLLVSYGFNSTGKGILNINSFKSQSIFDIEFTNVEIPLKESLSDENGLIATLDFSNKTLPTNIKNIKTISLSEFQVRNVILLNSNPKLKLIEKENYLLSADESLENVYFVLPKPKDSFISQFIAFLTISILLGIFGSIKLLNGKAESIWGLISGILILVYLGYLLFSKIIPDDFTKDIDKISLVGGGIGLCFGIIANSTYNLIKFKTIERLQQS